MSLDPRDSRRRGRSKSPGGRDDERDRSRSRADDRRVIRAASPPSSKYDDPRDRGYSYEETTKVRSSREPDLRDPRYGALSQYRSDSPLSRSDYAMPGSFRETDITVREETKGRHGERKEKDYYKEERYSSMKDEYGRKVSPPERDRYETDKYKYNSMEGREREREKEKERERDRERERERERERDKERERDRERERDARRYEEEKQERIERERRASFNISAGKHSMSGGISVDSRKDYGRPSSPGLAYGESPYSPPSSAHRPINYHEPKQWEYAPAVENVTYNTRTETSYGARPLSPAQPYYAEPRNSRTRVGSTSHASESARSSKSQIVTVEPSTRNRRDASPGPSSLAPRMHSLSISTGHHGGASMSLANAPGSPLLEAYHGTYQSISPMPSPLMIASTAHSDLNVIDTISPLSSEDEGSHRRGKKSRRTARFHDPVEEATILAKALKGEKHAPDAGPLIEILPGLTHEQILDLRVEYKKIVKTGSEKKGVNIAKHIKLRLKEEDPMLMKACYACALGRWESEAYWANFWYQGEKSRRELLIESLMGRTNREIQLIKDGFSDKKYSDSLTKCMRTELKEDKFKKAILLVLEEKRMEEQRPGYGLDRRLVEEDVRELYKAVRSEKGGESAMISIVVVRSDSHLREVLRLYESTYRANFAREMLKKSGNLVGELLAHILNGVINKPVRDALLVHHALSLSKSDHLRTELLISRLVRYHWDRPHMEAVKREYRSRYNVEMQAAVKEHTKGEWGRFCEALCVRRMGDEVREVRRVEEFRMIEER